MSWSEVSLDVSLIISSDFQSCTPRRNGVMFGHVSFCFF